MRGVRLGRRSLPFGAVWELIRPHWGGWGELMILAGWGGIPDLGSCPQGIAVMWQLICGYYQRPKDLFRLKCQLRLSFPFALPSSSNPLSLKWPRHVSFRVCDMQNSEGDVTNRLPCACFSPCLQEADSVPGPDLRPAAGRSHLPVDPVECKSDKLTSTQVTARWQQKRLRSVSTPAMTLHMTWPPCTARMSFHGTKLLRPLMYFLLIKPLFGMHPKKIANIELDLESSCSLHQCLSRLKTKTLTSKHLSGYNIGHKLLPFHVSR